MAGIRCISCHDQIADCGGGAACPFFNLAVLNSQVLRDGFVEVEEGGQRQTCLECAPVLPASVSRAVPNASLDFLKNAYRQPRYGTQIRLADKSAAELVELVTGGSLPVPEAATEILKRIPTVAAAESARLQGVLSALSTMQKSGFGQGLASMADAQGSERVGVYTLVWALAGRVIRFDASVQASVGESRDAGTAENARSAFQAKIIRPKDMAEFAYLMNVWTMLMQATGLANPLVSGAFLLKVVHEQMVNVGMTWTHAHELVLLYFEAIELQPREARSRLTLANVYDSGGQDSFRERAALRARQHFRTPAAGPPGFSGGAGSGLFSNGFRGGCNMQGSPCYAWNFGKAHAPESLDSDGNCTFAHKCDRYLKSGGKCGSTKHGRHKCDNPDKK